MAHATRPTASALECRQLVDNVVLLSARGLVTRSSMLAQLDSFRGILGRMKDPGWIIDMSSLSDFEAGAVAVGTEWFKSFKSAGGRQVVIVSSHATARMAAGTIAFAARLPLVTAESLSEACKKLGI